MTQLFVKGLDLCDVQFDFCFSSEERGTDSDLFLIVRDGFHQTDESVKHAVADSDTVADLESDLNDLCFDAELFDFGIRQRDGSGSGTNEACYARCVADNVPAFIIILTRT